MNVLVDRHHSGLYHSFELMARRFGWTLYTPVGHEWWDEWVWAFGRGTYPDDRLAQQFLMNWSREPVDGEFPDWTIRGVTLEQARQMPWAYVIATAQDNQTGFAEFARARGAQYVVQVGNTGQDVDWRLDPLALVSSEVFIEGRGIRVHQEMDPIAYHEPLGLRSARSFVNCMPHMGPCWDLLTEASQSVSVGVFGIDGTLGVIKPNTSLVDLMGASGWGWHDKAQGDGFGHVIHSWAAVGRPLIGHASHYAGKMAEPLWVDGETCIDLDRHSVSEAVEIVRTISPVAHRAMCRAIRATFDELVDYDAEAAAVADFLGVAA